MTNEKKLTQNLNDDQLNTVEGGGISFSKLPDHAEVNPEKLDEQVNDMLNKTPEEFHYLVADIMEQMLRTQFAEAGLDPLAIENNIQSLKEGLQ